VVSAVAVVRACPDAVTAMASEQRAAARMRDRIMVLLMC
jgi:hypothetical protein